MPFELTYRVAPCDGGYAVMTKTMKGAELKCTIVHRDKALVEQWCRKLRCAAQVETDRRNDVLSGKRPLEDS